MAVFLFEVAKLNYIDSVHASLMEQGPLCRLETGDLLVIDPEQARHVENENFLNAPMPERLFKDSAHKEVLWRDVKKELRDVSSRQNNVHCLEALLERLRSSLPTSENTVSDLTTHISLGASQTLIPLIISGLTDKQLNLVIRDQEVKMLRFINFADAKSSFWSFLATNWIEFRAGRAVSTHLKQRRSGKLPDQCDSAAAVLGFGDRLTKGQAAYATMTVLTATAGAPGALSACLAFEMSRQKQYYDRLVAEHNALDIDSFLSSPLRSAPYTYCFVREVLRMWSFPIFTTRISNNDIPLGKHNLHQGDVYHLSSYFTHHHEEYWENADTFDPNRWLQDIPDKKCFVPFGWSARSCPGANIGLMHLMLVARLLAVELQLNLDSASKPTMSLAGTPLPSNFMGQIISK